MKGAVVEWSFIGPQSNIVLLTLPQTVPSRTLSISDTKGQRNEPTQSFEQKRVTKNNFKN